MNIKPYIAEFIGTLILTLAIILSMTAGFGVTTPLAAGLAMAFCVYTMKGISGAHCNPAITLGLLAVKKVSMQDAWLYVVAQLLGGLAAMQVVNFFGVTPSAMAFADTTTTGVSEVLGTFIFAMGVAAVAHGKISQGATGLVVGLAFLLGILLAAGSNGVLNPAVALGMGSMSLTYAFAPIVGAVIAMFVYRYMTE